ncbi:MAG: F0F1 ATP synthase subunit C [Betaproteobacteria bacterium]|nr:F0F1 ATP synthase subunit C [Betaproteobacteria bacterium]
MTASMISQIYAYTAIGVGIILAAAGLGSAIGWGLICSKTLEGISRQPEMRPTLMANMFIFAGLMESFPFIVLAFAMWFLFANPFVGALSVALKALGH